MNANEIFWLVLLTLNGMTIGLNVGLWAGSGDPMKASTKVWTAITTLMMIGCFARLVVSG